MDTDRPPAAPPWRPGPGRWDVLAGLAARVTAAPVTFAALDDGGATAPHRYEVSTAGDGLLVRATDARAAAYGLHQHLLHRARRRVCWDTRLPLARAATGGDRALEGTLGDAAGYYLNFCTYGYTAPFWDWDRWQREIDWMALHGITMPLALVGHEAALAHAYRSLGLGDEQVRLFLGASPYLPWQFMGCLDGWGTPMSPRWLDERAALGARVMERMLDYGMTPVLPAFVGHVPAELARPDTTTREWWGFTTHLLDPHDDRFAHLTRLVVEAQRELFGTAHLYAADPFIEMAPPDDDPGYLGALTASVLGGLRAADPRAVWVMQAWTFDYLDWWTDDRVAAFLDSVPHDALLVLDLWGEHAPQWRRFDGFRGKPWIWCALHDFGGRCDMFGDLGATIRERADAMACADAPIGVGLAMEATEQNHVLYELVSEPEPPAPGDLAGWVGEFAVQRYGVDDPRLARAWSTLLDTVYAAPAARLVPTERPSSVTLRPSAQVMQPGWLAEQVRAWAWYEPADLVDAGALLLGVLDDHPDLLEAELGHDVISVVATAMARCADLLLLHAVSAAHRGGDDLPATGRRFLALLDEIDTILDLQPQLRVATWDAAAEAADPATPDAAQDARRLLTVWNHSERAALTDYAARLWSGLVGGLYRARWRAWLDAVDSARLAGAPVAWDRLDDAVEAITADFVDNGPAARSPSPDPPLALVRRALGACAGVLAARPAATTPFPQEHQR